MLTMLGGLVEFERELILACAPASVASSLRRIWRSGGLFRWSEAQAAAW
jgi:hypothetical protein